MATPSSLFKTKGNHHSTVEALAANKAVQLAWVT